MVYNKKMTNIVFSTYDIFMFLFTCLIMCLFIGGMMAIGWFARGFYEEHQQKYEQPSKILQPQFSAKPAPVLPPTAHIPTPDSVIKAEKKSVVMRFPKPSEVKKRKDQESLSTYLESLVSQPRESGALSIDRVLPES